MNITHKIHESCFEQTATKKKKSFWLTEGSKGNKAPEKTGRTPVATALLFLAFLWLCVVPGPAAEPISMTEPFIWERGPHHRQWMRLVTLPGPNGAPVSEMRSAFIELGSGLHRREGNGWVESSDELELFEGGAIARKGQHQLILSPSIADVPAIDMELGSTRLQSRIWCLAYFCAATGRSVLLGEIRESIGELTARNECTWSDCFTDGIKADVRCTYRLDGIAVDVVLREQLPDPGEWDILPENCRVQVWTAFLDPPEASTRKSVIRSENNPIVRAAMHDPDFTDDVIAFPDLHFTRGKAFAIETPAMQAAGIDIEKAAPVGKQWIVVNQIRYLVESAEWNSIADFMATLPVAANRGADNGGLAQNSSTEGSKDSKGKRKSFASVKEMVASSVDKSPTQKRADSLRDKQSVGGTSYASPTNTSGLDRSGTRVARPNDSKRAIQIARAPDRKPGLVIDYTTLNSSLTNVTFSSVETYYISGPVTLYGNSNVAIGGCVVKFSPTNNAKIDVKGRLIFDTDMYRPFILGARDQHEIGEAIGSASLSGKYANTALRFDYNTTNILQSVTNVRIMYASKALEFVGGDGHDVRHAQFIDCGTAIHVDGGRVALRNGLGWNLTNALTGASSSTSTGLWEHVTLCRTTNLVTTATGRFTNCLLVSVVSTTGLSGSPNSVVSSSNGVFATVGGGRAYLVDDTYRNLGTNTIQPQLAQEIAQRSTYKPLVLSNTLAVNTVLSPQAGRDTDTPDMGWHAPPLDWWACGINVNSNVTLTLTNGVCVGMDYISNSWGFILKSANLLSVGRPTLYNRLVRADTAQETSGGNPGTRACFYDDETVGNGACELRLRFTEFSQLANGGYMLYTGQKFRAIEYTYSRIYNPWLVVDTGGSLSLVCGLTNSLWERPTVFFGSGSTPAAVRLHLRNNLFRYQTLSLQGNTNWTVRDNLFESMAELTDNSVQVSNSHNAYFNMTYGLTNGANVTNLSSLAYEVGPLGKFYQPTNSILIGFGSQNATNAGLYHWCVTTNSVKETNSVVDVGLHYVAVDASGQPQDSDSDGVPDYLEDANGNGAVDSGESDWQTAGNGAFRVYITRPRDGSHIP